MKPWWELLTEKIEDQKLLGELADKLSKDDPRFTRNEWLNDLKAKLKMKNGVKKEEKKDSPVSD